jgi:hypothetical protein
LGSGFFFAIALSGLFAADAGAGGAERTDRIDLKDAKDGSGDLLYEESGFTARIAPDGSVRFKDKRVSEFTLLPWLAKSGPSMGVPSLQSSLKMLMKGREPPAPPPSPLDQGRPPPETLQLIPEVSQYRPDPRENCRVCTTINQEMFPKPLSAFGRGDLTDEIMRFSGKDPYRYQKAVFLAATHDRRIRMAVRAHAENIRRARADLPRVLPVIACDPRLTHKERREILAALAAEMDAGTPEGKEAAASINAFLVRFDSGSVVCPKAP